MKCSHAPAVILTLLAALSAGTAFADPVRKHEALATADAWSVAGMILAIVAAAAVVMLSYRRR